MAASMKMAVLWNVEPCSLVEVHRRFRGTYCIYHQGDDCPDDGGRNTSESSVKFYHNTRRHIPEDSHLNVKIIFVWILFPKN
jgi:hypothetical protein